jgi:hypothetical protein
MVWLSNTVGFWKLAADAEFGDAGLIQPRQVGHAVEQHRALVRLGLAGDDVHHRGLAGAVRADDGAHLAGLERQRQIVDGVKAVERDVHAVEDRAALKWSFPP